MVNVEYRLAPEHRFPANQDDVNCVIEWVAKNKPAVGMYYVMHIADCNTNTRKGPIKLSTLLDHLNHLYFVTAVCILSILL